MSIDPKGEVTVLADKYENKRFNSLNDLWIDPKGGIYFITARTSLYSVRMRVKGI